MKAEILYRKQTFDCIEMLIVFIEQNRCTITIINIRIWKGPMPLQECRSSQNHRAECKTLTVGKMLSAFSINLNSTAIRIDKQINIRKIPNISRVYKNNNKNIYAMPFRPLVKLCRAEAKRQKKKQIK